MTKVQVALVLVAHFSLEQPKQQQQQPFCLCWPSLLVGPYSTGVTLAFTYPSGNVHYSHSTDTRILIKLDHRRAANLSASSAPVDSSFASSFSCLCVRPRLDRQGRVWSLLKRHRHRHRQRQLIASGEAGAQITAKTPSAPIGFRR